LVHAGWLVRLVAFFDGINRGPGPGTDTCRRTYEKFVSMSFFARFAAGLTLLVLLSCAKQEAASEKHYQLSGIVLGVDSKDQTATIQHGPIQGWMDAMTMDYPIRSKHEFEQLKTGEHITATVNVRGTDYDLSGIHVESARQ
jgi:Cu/Ag efflux protein CusF